MNDAAARDDQVTIALAGNPNAGKTTLFNSLTGLRQKVANYPGVTVERKEGQWQMDDRLVRLIDLPRTVQPGRDIARRTDRPRRYYRKTGRDQPPRRSNSRR